MPNGRLSRCVIPTRTPSEVYHNSSGEAASVTLTANTISTDTNTEMTVVVGIASTTLSAVTTMVTAAAGTFCSMTNTLYAYDYNHNNGYNNNQIGVAKTFIGMNKLPRCNICAGDSNSTDYIDANVSNVYEDPQGCTMTRINCYASAASGQCTFVYNCLGSSNCVYQQWGGNEQQNPSIWMRQLPASCNCCGYFWGGKIVGYFYNCCCSCCWAPQTRCNGTSGTWHPIKAVNVGMGVSTNAAINASQVFTNWCCCCGKIGNNKMPIVQFNGCPSCYQNDAACFGNVCNYQYCKMCACCCNCGAGYKMWNWYALDREFQCCCDDFNNNEYQCFKQKTPPQVNTFTCQCFAKISEGALLSPLWGNFYWCQGQSQGCVNFGHITTCWYAGQPACGENTWNYFGNQDMSTPDTSAYYWYYNSCKWCHPCCTNNYMVNGWNTSEGCKLSPFGFSYGMTNCSLAFYSCSTTTSSKFTYRYSFTYPDACYGRRCQGMQPCYMQQWQKLWIQATDSTGAYAVSNELPIKYWAWNCMGVTNKHGTCGCTYIMIRSADPDHCGIFTMDAHDSRVYQGPYCGCNGDASYKCGEGCFGDAGKTWYPCDNDRFTRVGDFPTAMSCDKYVNQYGTMCMSCLYRTDLCNWIILAYDATCVAPRTRGHWDAFESNDLITWTKVASPYSKKVSSILTTCVTSDYACIVDDCNCFFSSIDCSGIIDWKLSAGQYERTGIVLSDGDRIMVNNDGDVKTSFQVWGYEG